MSPMVKQASEQYNHDTNAIVLLIT